MVVCSSTNTVKDAAREIVLVIIFAAIDDGILNQLF